MSIWSSIERFSKTWKDKHRHLPKGKVKLGAGSLKARGLRIEQFEQRVLLAIGPELVAVIPNAGSILEADDVLDVAPRELLLRFSEGQDIDPASLDGIQIVRSGGDDAFDDDLGVIPDVTVEYGWSGIGDRTNEVIVRFAETLPDDIYRINILGTGSNPLTNMAGEPFGGGGDESLPFELDLGAQVVSVVPQPIQRQGDGSLDQARNQIVVYFNNDDLDPVSAENPDFYQLIATNDTATTADDTLIDLGPGDVVYDPVADMAVLSYPNDLETYGTGSFRLRIGDEYRDIQTSPLAISVVDPGPLVLVNNTRLRPVPGAMIADGDTFTLTDGSITVVFEFEDTTLVAPDPGIGVQAGNVAVGFTPADTINDIALAISTAINGTHQSPGLFIMASQAMDVVPDVTPGIIVTPTIGLKTTESGGQAQFTVMLLSQPAANVTIGLSSDDATEGTVSPGSLTFTPGNWNLSQIVTVTGVDDGIADGNKLYSILTGDAVSADPNYDGMVVDDVSLGNIDDETVSIPSIQVSPTSGLETTESGGTAQFSVVLGSPPAANVTVPISSNDTGEGTVSAASLVFTAANWDTPQTVTVTGVDDVVVDGDVAYTIVTDAAVSADPAYSGINPADVSVTNTDNDTPVSGDSRLFAVPADSTSSIVELDPATGAETHRFDAPEAVSAGPNGLAFDGSSLFYISGYGSDQIWELNPDTGAVLDVDPVGAGSGDFDGLAALGGKVYILDYTFGDILEFDPGSDSVTATLNPGVDLVGGLAGITAPDALIATDASGGTVVEINPANGQVTNSFAAGGTYYGAAVVDGEIYLGSGASPVIDVFSRAGVPQGSVNLPYIVSALGGDDVGGGGSSDFNDPLGDTFGIFVPQLDIANVQGSLGAGEVTLRMDFFTPIAAPSTGLPNAVVGYWEFDLDQNPATGAISIQSQVPPGSRGGPLGVETSVDLFSESSHPGSVDLINATTGVPFGQAPITYGTDFFEIVIPLAVLGDDGILNFGTVIGTVPEATDAAPNTVFGTTAAGAPFAGGAGLANSTAHATTDSSDKQAVFPTWGALTSVATVPTKPVDVAPTNPALPKQRQLFELDSYLSEPSTDAPLDVALGFLTAHAAGLGLLRSDLAEYEVTDQYVSQHTGVTHIYLAQTLGGIEVVGANINVNVTADGRVLNVGSSFVGGLGGMRKTADPTPQLSAPQAMKALADDFEWDLNAMPEVISRVNDPGQTTMLAASGISLEDVPAELVYMPTANGGVELAWNLVVQTTDWQHWYYAVVSATDGDVVYVSDWVDEASYNVFGLPLENPDDGVRTLVVDPADPIASPFGWHDLDGLPGAEYTLTAGNNVAAYADRNDDDVSDPGSSPDGGVSLVFDYPIDFADTPLSYQPAAVTNLFYWTNISHDVHYQYGFDEASGNFQENNYGNGGLGGDWVHAQAQDGANIGNANNANFATPPDGSDPRMQMYEFNITSPRRDGDLANQIIVHEFGHGVSNRLTGGPANANALNALQSGGMGEGWSDWWSLLFTQKPTDAKMDPYAVGTYVLDDPAGIRRVPYSFDMSIDPLTYDDYNGSSEVHDAGEIWCSVLWDMNWLLIDQYGFDADLYNGTAGNNLAMQLVMDGLKLQPASPTFLDGRDAILLADQVLTGGQNIQTIWTAFARRGMGFSAYDGGNANATTVIAAFDMPATSTGTADVGAAKYEVGDQVLLTVRDLDLSGGGPIGVTLTSDGGDSETVTLSELGLAPGVFEGSIQSATSPYIPGNGILEVFLGDVITVTYNDADDGSGSPAVVTDTADIIAYYNVFFQDFENGLSVGESTSGGFTINNTNAPLNNGTLMMGHPTDYSNDEYSYYQLTVDLTGITGTQMELEYSAQIENFWDRFNVQASTSPISPPFDLLTPESGLPYEDQGVTMHPLLGQIAYDGGGVLDSGIATFDLSAFDDQVVRIRFQFGSDNMVTYPGINLDNLLIRAETAALPGSITVTPTAGLLTTESGGSALFTVVLDTQPADDVFIGLATSDGSEGSASSGGLLFTSANWNVPQTVTVTGVDDSSNDGDVSYTIVTSPAVSADPDYAGINAADVTLTNIDNDTDALVVNLSLLGNVGTSFDSAQTLGGFAQALSPQGVIIPGYVGTGSRSLQMPGTSDEPGHRHIPPETHGADGSLGGSYSFSTLQYNFRDNYGSLPNGQRPQNLITENQKDRAREVFALYGYYLGIEFVETPASGLTVVTGDIRVINPTFPSGPGGVGGIGGGSVVVMNAGLDWGNSEYGGGWFNVAMHEIGHSLGLGHTYDLTNLTVMGGWGAGEGVFPGDHDLVHLNTIYQPAGNDLDLFKFTVDEAGWFTAETVAERQANSSLLNSKLTLYQERVESTGLVREVIANNDDYFSNDSFIGMQLQQGTYYIGVTSTGTTDLDPRTPDTGFGGTTEGFYDLVLEFTADPTESLVDATGTAFDGDADGVPGGSFDFWFTSQDTAGTHFVDKLADPATADGSLGNPYTEIDLALAAANAGDVVRIVGNAGGDDDPTTLEDNVPYLVGFDNFGNILEDGARIQTPAGVTLMIDAGVLFKMNKANIEVGSVAQGIDLGEGALQVLGTPDDAVYFRSYRNDEVGGDDDGPSSGAASGDFGGLVFREDSDREDDGIFLNWVSHADINNGGGKVTVNSTEEPFAPIHMITARPTVVFSTITNSAAAAISADPDSFEDTPGRVGPDVHGNRVIDNSINGLFIRIATDFGSPVDSLDVSARWDDTDIVHVVTESLLINGTPAGPYVTTARLDGRLAVDPGMVVKFEGSRIDTQFGAQFIAEGLPGYEVVLTALKDDRFGAGGTFDTSGDADNSSPAPGHWGGLVFRPTSQGNLDHVLLSYAGGTTAIEGGFDQFNAVEINQATVRIANSALRENASGKSSSNRNGLGSNVGSTVFVRGAQPIILNNIFADNAGDAININANAMQARLVADSGRTTGPIEAFTQFGDNHGPLVRLNRLGNNGTNGMAVRGATLTTETVWDDTDIAHVLRSEIVVLNHHTFSGIRLQSSTSGGLVVKLDGANAGFTADGTLLDIDDRIGGTIQIVGVPGRPVVLTSLSDDSFPAGFDVEGNVQGDTNNDGPSTGSAGDWRSIRFEELANSRNSSVMNETEPAYTAGNDANSTPFSAEFLGNLAPNEKSGDDNRRLGFEMHGFISPDDTNDVDVYSFHADTGTEIWFDVDRTGHSLDSKLELIQADGTVLATSISNGNLGGLAQDINKTPHLLGDFYTTDVNRDPAMRVVLPGQAGASGLYFIRVSSNNGQSQGEYQLQVRLRQVDEYPGSTVRFADIHYASDGIEILGMPAHSPLIGESGEAADGTNNTFGGAQQLGNLLGSDRNTISVGGDMSTRSDLDWYTFTVDYDLIQAIAGVNGGGKTWAAIFDIDYADGLTRADTIVSVFDSGGNLILVSRDSDIDDDQSAPGQGADTDDLTRGSFGELDPYIGTVQLPAGVAPAGSSMQYYVAISSNYQIPTAINGVFDGSNGNALVRLEPINSVQRVAEDHIGFQGYTTGRSDLGTSYIGPEYSLFDIGSEFALSTHAVPYTAEDVVLFISTGGSGGRLRTVNPFTGNLVTDVGALGGSGYGFGDIAMRGDGTLFGETLGTNNGNSGNFRSIDTGNAAATNIGDDGIPTNPNVGGLWDALAFRRTGDAQFQAFAANNLSAPTVPPLEEFTPSLWKINQGSGARIDESSATDVQRVGDLPGYVTGLAFASPSSSTLFAVTIDGTLYKATITGTSSPTGGTSRIANPGWELVATGVTGGAGATGLTLGPQNLDVLNSYDGNADGFPDELPDGTPALADVLFASSSNSLYAFDFNGNPRIVFDNNGDGVAESSSTGVTGGITGLAFSPLDFNLWHTTEVRLNDAGHGINPAFDVSRESAFDQDIYSGEWRDSNERIGGASFYFGLENWVTNPNTSQDYFRYGPNAQLGISSQNVHRDLTSNSAIGGNYNLPGGAQGSLVTNPFSLANHDYEDKPTVYFNYFLATEGAAGTTVNDNMRDSARVWISNNGGASWDLLATNNSQLSIATLTNELPRFISTSSAADFSHPQQTVQELFDNTGVWRQARVDLGLWAGDPNLILRFDFTTAGTMNDSALDRLPWEDSTGDLRDEERGQDNAYEGFFVDDIIIGYAERGEMATGTGNLTTFSSVPQNPNFSAPLEILRGPYQLEIRRGTEYGAVLTDITPNIFIYNQLDTDTALVREDGMLGDRNFHREQDQLQIMANTISDVTGYGILVDAGARASGSNMPYPGSVRKLPTLNGERLVPGVVLVNNVIANVGQGGILFSGDPNSGAVPMAAVPFGLIVNNTVYGGESAGGIGIQVTQNAAPTLLNNILANMATGIAIDATSSSSTVVGSNLFSGNNNNGTTGSNAIFLAPGDPLFVNPAAGNFYLASGSNAIDSSLNSLQDRPNIVAVKSPLGIPQSPILAPEEDRFGQLRVDDPSQDPPPGMGFNIFKDRGAVERADFVGPVAWLSGPEDNGLTDFDGADNDVILVDARLTEFTIQLLDLGGIGIDDSAVTPGAVEIYRSMGIPATGAPELLISGVDYLFSYDATNDLITLFPAPGVWPTGATYTIVLDNTAAGIRDLAGNTLGPNRSLDPFAGMTVFNILFTGMDWGDAPDGPYPTLNNSNGAAHLVTGITYLGSAPDWEPDSKQNADASGDSFDDGVLIAPALLVDTQTTITVNASGDGFLNAWIDFNGDGDWSDSGEQVFTDQPLTAGDNSLLIDVPGDSVIGFGPGELDKVTFGRFRFSSETGLEAIGYALDGEVEDYQLRLVKYLEDYGDAPDPYPTYMAQNGASHYLDPAGPHLGALVDAEYDGQPDPMAAGDDLNGPDEDGIILTQALVQGGPTLTIGFDMTASPVGGFINAWIDYNQDGDWADVGEHVFTDVSVLGGVVNDLLLDVPDTALPGYTFARIRVSSAAGLSFDGKALDGEVEDYIVPVTTPPTAVPGGPYAVDEGSSVTLDASASFDPDGTVVLYEWDLDDDGTYETTGVTAVFTGVDDGTFNVGLRVTDNSGATDTASVTVDVNNVAPTPDAGPDQIADEAATVTFSGTFTDPGILDTHTFAWDFGDGGTDSGSLSSSHVYVDNGTYTVTLAVTDDDGGIGTDTLVVVVNNVAPVVDAGPDQVADEGDLLTFSGSFTDVGILDTHTIDWDFGDGSTDSGSLTTSHIYADNGDYTVTLTITDNDDGVGTDTLIVTVGNVAPTVDAGPDQTGNEGDLLSFSGSLFDPGTADTHTIEWDYGDGTFDSGTLTPTHAFGDNGVFIVRLTITDDDGGVGSDTLIVTIDNVAPIADAGPDQTVDEGDTVVFAGSIIDPGSADTHTILWDFGDGSTDSGSLTPTHVYTDDDLYTVTLSVTDDDGESHSDTMMVTVLNVAPTAVTDGPYNGDEGSPITISGAGSFDPGLDIVLYEWDLDYDGITFDADVIGMTTDVSMPDDGTFTVALRVTDDDDAFGIDTTTVFVDNVAPIVDAGADQTIDEGDTASFFGSFTDPGILDTHTFAWDFGDGATATGSLTADHLYVDNGVFTVTLTVTDDDGGVGVDTVIVTVNNVAPIVDAGPGQNADEGDQVDFSGSFTDPGILDTHTIEWDFGDGNTASGTLTPSHVYADDGPYIVTLTVTDNDYGVGTDTLVVTVNNVAPTVWAGPDRTAYEGEELSIGIGFFDPGSADTHTFEWDFGDGTIDSSSLHTYADNGVFTVTVTVTDDDGGVGSDTVTVTVNNVDPVAEAGNDQTVDEGDLVIFGGSFVDPGSADTHVFDWDFGDGSTGSGSLTPGHAYADNGVYIATLTVTDDDGGVGTDSVTITVNNVAPTVDLGADRTVDEGDLVSFTATITDPGILDTHYVLWDFGDGSGAVGPGWVDIDHIYYDNGTYTVTVTVTDNDGGVGVDTLIVTVDNVAPLVDAGADQTVDENDLVNFAGAFSDPGLFDTHTIEWDFGDGGTDSGSLTPSHVFADNGFYTVTLTVTDNDGGVGVDTLMVTVNNVSPTVDAGVDQSVNEGDSVIFVGSMFDPGTLDTHTILWEFGDGNTDTGSLTPSHAYADNGTYTVTLTVTDDDDGVGTDTLTVTVANVDPIPEAGANRITDEGTVLTFTGSVFDAGSADTHTGMWDFGDGTSDDSGSLSTSHAYADDGVYIVTLRVTDDDGGVGVDTLDVIVNNVAPSVNAGVDQTSDEGSQVDFAGSFTDPGVLDTHTFGWDFGDGGSDSGSLTTSHVFAANGTYLVTLTVTDNDGGVGTDTLVMTVNNVAPTADAGGPYVIDQGSGVILDASASSDPGMDIVLYEWDVDGDGDYDDTVEETQDVAWSFLVSLGADYPADPVTGLPTNQIGLRVTDSFGATATSTTTLTIYDNRPFAAFSAVPNPAEYLQTIDFDATASWHGHPAYAFSNYEWDFDYDGTTFDVDATGVTTSNSYPFFGEYTVALRVTDNNGVRKTDMATVTVDVSLGNHAPVADIGGPYVIDMGSDLLLNASESSDPDSVAGDSIVAYEWDLDNDGVFGDATGVLETIDWATLVGFGADYPADPVTGLPSNTIGLRVTDSFGLIDTATTTLTIYDNSILPVLNAGPSPVAYNQTVDFSAAGSSHGHPAHAIVSYDWDFNYDGVDFDVDATGLTAAHAYPLFGQYTVALRLSDNNLNPRTATSTVLIDVSLGNHAPVADAAGPYVIDLGDDLQLDGSASSDIDAIAGDSIVSYDWDLNDDGIFDDAFGESPLVPAIRLVGMAADQTLPIRLQVTDSFGLTDTASSLLTIIRNYPPVADPNGPYVVAEGAELRFHGTGSTDDWGIISYEWDLDYDGTTFDVDLTGKQPEMTFADDFATRVIALRVTDTDGVTDIQTSALEVINVAPTVLVTSVPTAVDEGTEVTLTSSVLDPGTQDTHTYEWAVSKNGIPYTADGTDTAEVTFTPDDEGVYKATLTVTDDDGGVGTDSVFISGQNAAPVVTQLELNRPVVELGEELIVTGAFTDAGALDTHTVDINWGDIITQATLDPVTRTFTATHTYVTAIDVFAVGATVIDNHGDGTGDGVPVAVADILGPVVFFNDIIGLDTSVRDFWYTLESTNQGWFTMEAIFRGPGDANLTFYDIDLNQVATSSLMWGNQRIDRLVSPGEKFYVQLSGTSTDVALRAVNLVDHSDSTVTVLGTDNDDTYELVTGTPHQLTVNGVRYEFDPATVDSITIDGGDGRDTLVVAGSDGTDAFTFNANGERVTTISNAEYQFTATAVETVAFDGTTGSDSVVLIGTPGDETGNFWPDHGTFEDGHFSDVEKGISGDFAVSVSNVSSIKAFAAEEVNAGNPADAAVTKGIDAVYMYDSPGDDRFESQPFHANMSGPTFAHETFGFMFNYGYATTRDGGFDVAVMEDSDDDDKFKLDWPKEGQFFGKMYRSSYYNRAKMFEDITAQFSDGPGVDTVRLFDSPGDDQFTGQKDTSRMTGPGFDVTVSGYESLIAYASAGNDVASLFDSELDDTIRARSHKTVMYGTDDTGAEYTVTARRFDEVHATANMANGGFDVAKLHDTSGDDHLELMHGRATLSRKLPDGATDLLYEMLGFDRIRAYGLEGGNDTANLQDTPGDDLLKAEFMEEVGVRHSLVSLWTGAGASQMVFDVIAFDAIEAASSTGRNVAEVADGVDFLMLDNGWEQ